MNLFHLKPALLSLLFFWQIAPQPATPFTHFRYQRAITLPAASAVGQACAILDPDVFAHAAPALKDLRLYNGSAEVPYSTTVSEPPQQDTDEARILNLDAETRRLVFDLEMPHRPYTSVILDLAPRDFIATAIVSGSSTPGDRSSVQLGSFTLFDLTSQHLSRSTTIPLSESSFPYLHVELAFVPAPGTTPLPASLNVASTLKSVTVPPSREAQSLYTAAQPPKSLIQTGQDGIAAFNVAARVPIERIAFMLPPGYKGDFSRSVKIEARGIAESDVGNNSGPVNEETSGTILRIHKSEAGHDLSAESLTIPVAIGSNMQQPASVEVRLENGSDATPPLSVELQMRQRSICFDTGSLHAPLTLYYGAPSLDAPSYPAAATKQTVPPRIAQLEAESLNPRFTASPSPRRLAYQQPVLRWVAILGCVCIFALLVIRRTHKRRR